MAHVVQMNEYKIVNKNNNHLHRFILGLETECQIILTFVIIILPLSPLLPLVSSILSSLSITFSPDINLISLKIIIFKRLNNSEELKHFYMQCNENNKPKMWLVLNFDGKSLYS